MRQITVFRKLSDDDQIVLEQKRIEAPNDVRMLHILEQLHFFQCLLFRIGRHFKQIDLFERH